MVAIKPQAAHRVYRDAVVGNGRVAGLHPRGPAAARAPLNAPASAAATAPAHPPRLIPFPLATLPREQFDPARLAAADRIQRHCIQGRRRR